MNVFGLFAGPMELPNLMALKMGESPFDSEGGKRNKRDIAADLFSDGMKSGTVYDGIVIVDGLEAHVFNFK